MDHAPSPLLLSRVAECAYWAGRYLERAEGTARLVKCHADLVMDLPRAVTVGWDPLLAVLGMAQRPDAGAPVTSTEESVVGLLTADASNPGSVRSSIAAARANLRVTRAVMPQEAAEVLIDLHNHVELTADEAIDRRTRTAWLTSVIRVCQTLSAILADTMSHDDAYCFFTVGRQLERADLTTRVLDVQVGPLTRGAGDALGPYLDICWFAALRSVSALQPFRRTGRPTSAEATISFLLRDPKCPRTVESCLTEASRWLLEIPGHEQPMAACASAQRLLQSADARALADGDLHRYVDELQVHIGAIHEHIAVGWFAHEPAPIAG